MEGAALAEAFVRARVDGSRFGPELRKTVENTDVDSSSKKLGGRMSKGIADGFVQAGAKVGKLLTIGGAAAPAIGALGASLSAAAAGGTALAGALGPAAAAGAATYVDVLAAAAQGTQVFKFATAGLTDALAGNKDALKKLTPDGRALVKTLSGLKPEMEGVRRAAQSGLFPGLEDATQRLAEDFLPLLRKAARQTGNELGGLAVDAGKLADSGPWRQDFATATKANAVNLGLMGHVSLSLADAARSLYITALPVTRAFLKWADGAAQAVDKMVQANRASGDLDRFWQRAMKNGAQFGRILGDVGGALFNVFKIGSSPTGTRLLDSVETMTKDFREWTSSASGAATIAKWFAQGRDNLQAMGRLLDSVLGGVSKLGAGAQLAPLIDQITKEFIPPVMEFLHNASASGALSSLVTAVSQVAQVFADLSANDSSLKAFAVTLGAVARAARFIIENVPGAGAALGAFFVVVGATQALKLVGLGPAMKAIATGISGAGRASVVAGPQVGGFVKNVETASTGKGLTGGLGRFTQFLGGPWTLALGAGIGILGVFAAKHAASKAKVDSLTASLDAETGAITGATRAQVADTLQKSGALQAAQSLGLNLRDVTDAALGNRKAQHAVTLATEDARQAAVRLRDQGDLSVAGLFEVNQATNKVKNAISGSSGAMDKARADAARLRGALSGLGSAAGAAGHNFSAGLAAGIIAGGRVAVAAAVGVANKVTAALNSRQGFDSHSPSKKGEKSGRELFEGVAVGMKKAEASTLKAATDLAKKITDRLDNRLSHATDRLTALKDQARQAFESASSAVKGVLDITQIGAPISTTDANGVTTSRTPSANETTGGFAAQAKAFAAALTQMAAKHLAPSLIAAVAAAGPASGLVAAQALATETPAEVVQTNADVGTIDKAASQAGALNSRITVDPKLIAAAQKTVDHLAGIRKDLAHVNRQLANLDKDDHVELKVTKLGDLVVAIDRIRKKQATR